MLSPYRLCPTAQLALSGRQPGGQRCTRAEENADETQEVAGHFADASQGTPEALEEVDDGIHPPLIADEAPERNLP